MTESRPRPQYGEYATPEEQARAIGTPAVTEVAARHSDTVAAHRSAEAAVSAIKQPAINQPATEQPATEQPATKRQPTSDAAVAQGKKRDEPVQRVRSSRDLVITVTLLGIGLVWVLLSIPGASNLPDTLNRTYALQGYSGEYGPVALASTLGLLMNISSIVVWGITCAVSVALLRRHRRAAYVPIIGAVVAGAIALVLTLVAMLSDPGLIAYVNSLQA